MSIYPGALWEPIEGGSDAPMSEYLGAVLHVNESDGSDLFNWEQHGAHNMSSHFQIAKDGRVFQYIDTANNSWCQSDGNLTYLSIETQGFHTEPMTDAQVSACAALLAWMHKEHGIPLRTAEVPGQLGFGWHGMGGDAWGGHPDCPGDQRKAQRGIILLIAQGQTGEVKELLADERQWLQELHDEYMKRRAAEDQANYATTSEIAPAEGRVEKMVYALSQPGVLAKAIAAQLTTVDVTEAELETALRNVFAALGNGGGNASTG